MGSQFLVDEARVRKLAATRQGRLSLGGFAYQSAYAVARLASLYTGRRILALDGIPTLQRFDWAEDLDEVEKDGRVVFTQCKRVSDIGQAGKLADVLLNFAPKWLWTPADRRLSLRFRLVCTDRRFAESGPALLSKYRPRHGESSREDVIADVVNNLKSAPSRKSDRALWQEDAEIAGLAYLSESLWEQAEVIYLSDEIIADDPAGPLFRAEQEALAELLRMRFVLPKRQQQVLNALRGLVHSNVVAFDPTGRESLPVVDREPRVNNHADVYYALFEFQTPPEASPPFRVITRQFLDVAAGEPKKPFVARRPRWADVVHGESSAIRFLEREKTSELLAIIRDELLEQVGAEAALPMLLMLGAPGAGKTTLLLRVAARLVQEAQVVVAAPKLNLDQIEDLELEMFLQGIGRLEEGGLPVVLILDDPFFADSRWPSLLRRMATTSSRVVVLAASPEYLFQEFGSQVQGRQIDLTIFLLPRPMRAERAKLAVLYGRDPDLFARRDEDFLVLAMEASAGVSFGSIVERIWSTLNHGLSIDPKLRPEELPWTVRAYLAICYFNRFNLKCRDFLLKAILNLSERERPPDGFEYDLQRLLDKHGWSIFKATELGENLCWYGAAHPLIAVEAWRLRPVPSFDVADWIVRASLDTPGAEPDIGMLAALVESAQSTKKPFLARLAETWNQAALSGLVETRRLCSLIAGLLGESAKGATRHFIIGLRACLAREDDQSWLALWTLLRSADLPEVRSLKVKIDIKRVIAVANFFLVPAIAARFVIESRGQELNALFVARLNAVSGDEAFAGLVMEFVTVDAESAVVRMVAKQWLAKNATHQKFYSIASRLFGAKPDDHELYELASTWVTLNLDHPQVFRLAERVFDADPYYHIKAIEWIDSGRNHGEAYKLIEKLLRADDSDPAVLERAVRWIGDHSSNPQSGYLLSVMVSIRRRDYAIWQFATRWVGENITHPYAAAVLATLITSRVRTFTFGDAAGNLLRDELEAKETLAPAWPPIESPARDAQLRDLTFRVVRADLKGAERIFSLCAALARANPGVEEVRRLLLDVISENRAHKNVYWLLGPLVKWNPNDMEVRDLVIDWIKAKPDHPRAAEVLGPLVRSNPSDERARDLAVSWFLRNANKDDAYQLAPVLLAANPSDDAVSSAALAWVTNNWEHPKVSHVLPALIAASNGANGAAALGKRYLTTPERRGAIGVWGSLLVTSGAREEYIDWGLEQLDSSTSEKVKRAIVYQFSEASEHCLGALLRYLSAHDGEERRIWILNGVVVALLSTPELIEELLADCDLLRDKDVDTLLVGFLNGGGKSLELESFLATRLSRRYRKTGYQYISLAVRRNRGALAGILGLPDLDPRVRADLVAQDWQYRH
ncbi:MAG TPA: hypothetical protein VKY89_12945 [Thermoanaerobaculia bacterium]|nr:hypothetical protein [Thermoanaerobaculia bacterium]